MLSYMSQPFSVPYEQTMQEQNTGKQQLRQQSLTRPKKQSKVEKEEVWPEDVEQAFREALRVIPRMGRRKISVNNKPCGRNELIADYIFKRTQKVRTRKQVSSHIQVCKNMRRSERTLKGRFGQAAQHLDSANSGLMSKYEDPNYQDSLSSSSSDGEGNDSSNSERRVNCNNDPRRKHVRSNTAPDFGSDTRQYRLPIPSLSSSVIRSPSIYQGANANGHSAMPSSGRNDRSWQPNSPIFPPFYSRDFQRAPIHPHKAEESTPRQHPRFSPTTTSTFQPSTATKMVLPPLSNSVYPRTTPLPAANVLEPLAPLQIHNVATKPAMYAATSAFSTTNNRQTQVHPFQSNSRNPVNSNPTSPMASSATPSVAHRPLFAHSFDGQHSGSPINDTQIQHHPAAEYPREAQSPRRHINMDMGCDAKLRHLSGLREVDDKRNSEVSCGRRGEGGRFSYQKHRGNYGDTALCSSKDGYFSGRVNDFKIWPIQYRLTMAQSVNPTLSIFRSETHVLAQLECRTPNAYDSIPISALNSEKFQYLLDINLDTPSNLLLMKAKLDFSPHEGNKFRTSFFFESKSRRSVICDWIICSFGEIVLQHQEKAEMTYMDGKYRCQFTYIDDFFGALVSGIKKLQTWEAVDIAINNLSMSQIIRDAEDDEILLMVGNVFERGDGSVESYRVRDGSHLLGPMLDVRCVHGSGNQSDPICVDVRKSPPATSAARPNHTDALERRSPAVNESENDTRDRNLRKEDHHHMPPFHNHQVPTPESIHCSPVTDVNAANSHNCSDKLTVLGPAEDASARKQAEALLSLSDSAVHASDGC